MVAVFLVVEFLEFFFCLSSALLSINLESRIVLFVCAIEVGEADYGAVGMGEGGGTVPSIGKGCMLCLRLGLSIGRVGVAVVFESGGYFGGVGLQYESGGYVDWVGVYSLDCSGWKSL